MATLADSMVSSSARPLNVRMRPDLEFEKHRYQNRPYWIVKDPVGLSYFRFQEEEFALLNWLDGSSSLDDLRTRFEKQFAPQKITLEELGRLISMLHQSGLIIANVPGQGKQLLKRRGERKRKELLSRVSNVLAIRFKGIDPERLLNWLYPRMSWFFSKPAVIICLLMLASALTLVLVQFDTFLSKLPSFQEFFGPSNWMWLALAMGVTKVLHEFGHGLSCKHFGGECHEMGVMMLVLTPCLYCNVSDSWMLPNKWHRAFIGAAGMYVEVCIASIATFIWWFSEPGLLNQVCLSTMFVCSVSTVIFNGNPLLRYDGYYILSDIMEIPNLRQKATTILSRKLGKWCLGLEEPDDPFLPQTNQFWFMFYSVASTVYSWVVVFSILFFLYKVFEPYRLQIIGQIIAAMSIFGLVVRPLWQVGKFFHVPGRVDQVKKPRMYATLALVVAVMTAIVLVPLPYRIYTTLELRPREATSVYVEVGGDLAAIHVKPGQQVTPGTPLADLKNIDLDISISNLKAQGQQLRTQLAALERERFDDEDAGLEIPSAEKSLSASEQQLASKQRDLERLHLVSTADGVVIPPPSLPQQPLPDGRLPGWHGTPLERRNLGATLAPGTLLCQIGQPGQFDAILVVDQADIELVQVGQKVKIMLDEIPGEIFQSEITDVSPEDLKIAPRQLAAKNKGELATRTDPGGVERPASTSYQARAPLDDAEGLFFSGLKGEAKIDAGYHSLGWRFWRFLTRTFHFRL